MSKSIEVDEHGRSEIVEINGRYASPGWYGESLEPGDVVTLADDTEWVVDKVGTRIHTGGSGASNFVYVILNPGDVDSD